ncbi:MAG TPA: GAF domain-containing protein [Candidatus Binatia bacterium]
MTHRRKIFVRAYVGGIRRRLMLFGLVLLGAVLVLSTFAGSSYTRRQIYESTAALQTEIASATARQIHHFMTRKVERLRDAGVFMSRYPIGSEEQRLMTLLLLKNDPAFRQISILDKEGMERVKSSEILAFQSADFQNRSGETNYTQAIQGKIYIGPVRTSDRAEPYIVIAMPLMESPRKAIGVMVAQVHLRFLWEVIAGSRFRRGGYAYLIDENGEIIAHEDPSLVLKRLNLGAVAKVQRFLAHRASDPAPAELGAGINGAQVLSTYAEVPDLRWAVIVEQPAAQALSDLERLHRYSILLIGSGLLVGSGIIVWVSRKISRPIQELRQAVRTIRGGNLEHRAEITTGDEVEDLAQEFNDMAEALQTSYATLEQKVRQRTEETAALYEVTTAVNKSLDLQIILQAVIDKITGIFQFETTRIFLFNAEMEQMELRASFEVDPEHWTEVHTFRRGQGVIGRVVESGEPMIFENIETDPIYASLSSSRATQKAKLRFFGVLPIKTQSCAFGAIVFNGKSPRKLSADQIRLLTSMAEHLGVAVEKINLFDEVNTRSRHLAVLHTIGAAVSRSLNLETVLKEAVRKIAETLNFDAVWIYELEAEKGILHLRGQTGLSDEIVKGMAERSVASGISGQVVRTGRPLVFEDIVNDPQYRELTSAGRIVSLGFQAAAAFPIVVKESIAGTLHVVSRAKRHFSQDEQQLIQSIAQEIGVAVENARLFAEVKKTTSELEKTNQELLDATRAKSEFISAMSHELRTPLHVIIGNADLAQDEFFGPLNADQKTALQKILRNSRVLLKMINDVLSLSRIEARKMSLDLATVEIEELIEHARHQVEQINRDGRLEVNWDIDENLPPVTTDPIKLEEILQNLIANACKFTPKGQVDVRVRTLMDRDRVQFSVADTGIGIEAEDVRRIFQEFEQIKEAHTGQFDGVGLGLSIVKKYLDLLDGEIRVESQPGQGSIFTFSIPRSLRRHAA